MNEEIKKWLVVFGDTGADSATSVCSAVMYDSQIEAVEAAREHADEDAETLAETVREKGDRNGLPDTIYVETSEGRIVSYRILEQAITPEHANDPTADTRGMGLQELAIALGISPLQITSLNEIGEQIKDGDEGYLDVADSLTPMEDTYLRRWLAAEGIGIERLETSEGDEA